MRYFNKETKTEVIKGVHDINADVVELDDDNVFFLPIPDGKEINYDNGVPSGYTDYVAPKPTQEEINAEHRAYLASTDWYVTRKMETGDEIPQDILDARQAAREGVVE